MASQPQCRVGGDGRQHERAARFADSFATCHQQGLCVVNREFGINRLDIVSTTWLSYSMAALSHLGYCARAARTAAGVTQRELDYWEEKGLAIPSIRPAKGKGSDRRYSYLDLLKLRTIKELRRAGLSLQKIQKAVKKLKERDPDRDPLLTECLVTDGKQLHRVTKDPKALEDVLSSNRQLVFSVVFIGKLEKEVRRGIRLYERRAMVV